MSHRLSHLNASDSPVAGRGFSFIELLFAIAVLGIGFIMLAALFPVGLQQTKLTLDETAAAGSARGAAARVSQLAQSTYQYIAGANVPANTTDILPDTYVGPPVNVAIGQSVTRPGQVRSFRDPRDFVDAGTISAPNADARRNKLWSLISPLLLDTANERNAVSLMYKRDAVFTNPTGTGTVRHGSGTAQLIVVNAQVANAPAYVSPSLLTTVPNSVGDASLKGSAPSGFLFFNLEPRPVGVKIYYDANDGVWLAEFASIAATGAPPYGFPVTGDYKSAYNAAVNAVAEGAYVVISDDRIIAPATDTGRLNGRMFKIGVKRDDLGDVWQLSPGNEMTLDPGADGIFNKASDTVKDDIASVGVKTPDVTVTVGSITANQTQLRTDGYALAYVLGRGFDNPSTTPGPGSSSYAGPAQDVAIYTTFVAVP